MTSKPPPQRPTNTPEHGVSRQWETLVSETTQAQAEETERLLRKPRTFKQLLRMTERALARADAACDKASCITPPPQPVVCGANCPYCCHVRVTGSAPEMLLILDHIRKTCDTDAITALQRKVNNVYLVSRGKSNAERAHMRLPCPLLKDGSCSVHPVRPLSCRAVASVDLAACKNAYRSRMQDGVPMYELQYIISNAVGYGLHSGLVKAGYPIQNIELTGALHVGLQSPDCGAKWLRGERVFP